MKTYELKHFPRRASELKSMFESGKLTFKNAAQRSLVWKNTTKDNRKSLLIDSMIRGIPINPMYCNCIFTDPKKKVYDFADGKQRTNTIIEFMNDKFKLINIPLFNMDDEAETDDDSTNLIDLNGLTFSELSQDFQDRIRTYNINVYYFENLTQSEFDLIFSRINNGKSLSAIELMRVRAKSKEEIHNLANHPVFSEVLTDQARSNYTNVKMVLQAWTVLTNTTDPSLENADISFEIENAEISEEEVEQLDNIFTRLSDVHMYINQLINIEDQKDKEIKDKEKIRELKQANKRIYKRTHFISLVPITLKSIQDDITISDFAEWIISFYSGEETTISDKYNRAIQEGTAKAESVKARLEALEADYNDYFESDSDEAEADRIA